MWADGDLVHIDIGGVEQTAFFRNRQYGERIRAGLGGDGGAFERVERDVDARTAALRAANFFPDEQHWRFVALAFADDDGAIEIELVERVAHRFDSGGIGGLFITAANQLGTGDGGIFGDAYHFKHKDPVERRTARRGGHVDSLG